MYIILDQNYNNNFGKDSVFEDLVLASETAKILNNNWKPNQFKIFELKEIK